MGAEEFGKSLRARRKARGWTQTELAIKAKVKSYTIRAYEAGKVNEPGRSKVVALARALDWPGGVDAALALAGEGPLSDVEREFLPVPAPVDLFADVTRIWPQLSPRLQAAIVELFNAICEPHGPMGHDPVTRSRYSNTRRMAGPRESPEDPRAAGGARCEYT